MRAALLAALALALVPGVPRGLAAAPAGVKDLPATPAGRVNDFAGALDAGARAALEAQLVRYEQDRPGEQIAVVTLPALEGEALEEVSLRLAEKWRIGSRKDDGILLLVAVKERRIRIEVGYGAEGRLPDALASRIVNEIIGPRLAAGDYGTGLRAGAAAIHQALSGQPVTGNDPASGVSVPARTPPAAGRRSPWLGWGGLLFLFVLLSLLGGRRGGGRGFLSGMLLGSLFNFRGGGRGGGFGGGGGRFGGGGASGSY